MANYVGVVKRWSWRRLKSVAMCDISAVPML